jgi:hypothetical protein
MIKRESHTDGERGCPVLFQNTPQQFQHIPCLFHMGFRNKHEQFPNTH